MTVALESTDTSWHEFESVYERELNTVFGYLLARTGSHALAEDLTAEVFAQAAQHWKKGHSNEITGAWLTTVAKRRLVDHWRSLDAKRRRLIKLQRERPVHVLLPEADDETVLRALRSLSERQRIALTLRYLDGHSVSEVADILGSSYQGTESVLARGRRAFARAYEEQR